MYVFNDKENEDFWNVTQSLGSFIGEEIPRSALQAVPSIDKNWHDILTPKQVEIVNRECEFILAHYSQEQILEW